MDWKAVPMPPGLAARPRDVRGFPITFVTLIQQDGKPDFTTIDGEKIVRCLREALCGLCGKGWPNKSGRKDDHLLAFIGGPKAIEHRNFLDPPMHVECAEYAMKVCPHIAIPTSRYSKPNLDGPEKRELFEHVDPIRPERFGLYVTDAMRIELHHGQPVFFAGEPRYIEWQE